MNTRHVCAIVLVASAMAGQSTTVAAQSNAFRDGVRARDDGKWDEVISQMRAAIQSNGTESADKVRISGFGIFNVKSIEYVPYFFLGEALFSKGDCLGAVGAWEESERQGVVRRRQDLVAAIQRGYAACAAKGVVSLPDFQALVQRAEAALARAASARGRAADRTAEQNTVWRQTPSLQEQFDRSRADAEAAQVRLALGRRTRAAQDLNEARTLAERAEAGFTRMRAELDAAVEQHVRVQGQLAGIDRALSAAEELDRGIDPLVRRLPNAELPSSAAVTRRRARETLARARGLMAGPDVIAANALAEITRTVQEATAALAAVRDQALKIAGTTLEAERRRTVTAADESLSLARGAMATLDRLWSEKQAVLGADAAGERDTARRQFDAAVGRLTAARRAGDVDRIREAATSLSAARGLIDSWVARVSGARLTLEDRGVPSSLIVATRHYFAGEYQASLTALNDPALTRQDAPLKPHVHVFRAASLFALFVRSGEQAESLRAQAHAEIAACKQIDPGFQPDARAFGPRFRAFFAGAPER